MNNTIFVFFRIGKHYARQIWVEKKVYIMWMIFRQLQFTGRRNIENPRIALLAIVQWPQPQQKEQISNQPYASYICLTSTC